MLMLSFMCAIFCFLLHTVRLSLVHSVLHTNSHTRTRNLSLLRWQFCCFCCAGFFVVFLLLLLIKSLYFSLFPSSSSLFFLIMSTAWFHWHRFLSLFMPCAEYMKKNNTTVALYEFMSTCINFRCVCVNLLDSILSVIWRLLLPPSLSCAHCCLIPIYSRHFTIVEPTSSRVPY